MSVIVGNSRASPLSVKTDVDFVAIRPSPQAWKTVEHGQRWVGKLLVQEGITTWSPTPYSLAHLTLYSGFKKAMTESEREKFIARLNTTVAEVDAFEIEIQLADPATQIKRGPFKYVTLHFNNPTLIQLQTKVKKAVHQTILKKELTFEHIDFDKFHKTFVTHLTIGVLDAPNNHLDIDQLNDKKAKTLFSKQLAFRRKIDFQQQSIQLSVSDVELVGVTSLRAQLSERVY
ncbi:MAG TPA: 2'-5' RNA ligase family protein, partial [Chlamydiales bacterium]|nr:2'-5' RNA ligase family protein [Chlamydiales bacterium]